MGCGVGTWLKSALEFGVSEVIGIDGIDVRKSGLLVAEGQFRIQDLTEDWNLGRRFDLVLCLEVAEHLPASAAESLMESVTSHTDVVAFSSACPGQAGDHHINCQWPVYWQRLFNAHGFRCSDAIRWRIWNDERIEPWYRQNLFVATRSEEGVGDEARLPAVIHPEMVPYLSEQLQREFRSNHLKEIENGSLSLSWYMRAPLPAMIAKFRRAAGARRLARLWKGREVTTY